MLVKELIAKLQKMNPEHMVVIDRDEHGWLVPGDVVNVPGEDDDTLVSVEVQH